MFSGIGGFELGIKKATKDKWKCIGFSEIDKYAIQTFKRHFPGYKNYGDAKHIDWDTVPDFRLLCAGFPCQAFSMAGRKKGFDDTRGTLFFEICRAVESKKPDLLLLENVKGLLSNKQGNTFRTILRALDELGYYAEWEVLNSKNFGVPQNRERVFIIGHLREKGFRQVFPLGEKYENNKKKNRKQVSSTLTASYSRGWGGGRELICINKPNIKVGDFRYDEGLRIRKENISPTLTATMRDGDNLSGQILVHNLQPRSADRPSLTKECDCGSGKLYKKCHGVDAGTGHLSKKDGTSYTLDTGNTQAIELKSNIRRLTPIECERLQSFPDNWTQGVSDTQRYRQLGNAVTVNVIEKIMEAINENTKTGNS